jgi:hypothetical protein
MDALRIAARVAASFVSSVEETGVVRKTPGKGYCVKSEKNPDWSGGCYPTKGEADDRLKEVEKFKHMKARSNVCPECSSPPSYTCRCKLGDASCPSGHQWHWWGGIQHLGPSDHSLPEDHTSCTVVSG